MGGKRLIYRQTTESTNIFLTLKFEIKLNREISDCFSSFLLTRVLVLGKGLKNKNVLTKQLQL